MSNSKIRLKKSSVTGKVPLSGDLDYGELAINYADGIIYYKNSSNEIKSFIDSDLINTTIDSKLAAAGVGDSSQILTLIQNNSVDSSEVINLIDSDYIQSRQTFYSTAQFDSDFGTKTTTDLTEGSNLYFTELRAHDAIATYDSDINTTGEITASFFYGDGSFLTDVRAEKVVELVKNTTGGTLLKGTPVYPTGVAGSAVTIAVADASDSDKMPAIGVLDEDLLDEAEGEIVISGKIQGVDTTGYTAGDIAYVGVGGGWTDTPPTGEGNIVQALGYFTKIDSNGGGVVELGDERATPNLANGKIFLGVDGGEADRVTLNTTIVPEGTNLYYTTTRVDSDVLLFVDSNYIQDRQLKDFASEFYVDSNINVAINNLVDGAPLVLDTLNELAAAINDDENFASTITTQIDAKLNTSDFDSSFDLSFSLKTTDDLPEGSDVTNLYFSEARARAAISGNGGISYDSGTGVISLIGDIFNQTNFDSNFDIAVGNLTTDDLTQGFDNLYYQSNLFDSDFNSKSTDDLVEGVTNLYYTSTRVNSDISSLVDSAYVQSRQITYDFLDSSEVIDLIDSAYVQSRQLSDFASESYVQFYVDSAINNLIDGAPGALDTLNELAAAINDNENFASAITSQIDAKLNTSDFDSSFDLSFSLKTTDDLSEGSTNLYYTSSRVDSDILSLVDSDYVNDRVGGESTSYIEYYYSADSGQTLFESVDDNGNTLTYTPGSGTIGVYLNGILLDSDDDYSASSGSSIVLTLGADSGDIVQVQSFTSNLQIAEYNYTATAAQTEFTGLDNNSRALSYKVGYVEVYLNGVLLDPEVDYTATTGTSITLTSAAALNDFIQIVALPQFKNTVSEYADYYFSFVDSGGKTLISGNDSDGNLLQYRIGAIKVFNNGVLLSPDTDYNAVDGTTINFTTGLDSSDKVQIQAYNQSADRPSYEDVKVTSGIYVGGTSSDYLMQQYLNGAFTPTVEGESTAGTASYTTQVGHYTRIGNVVNFTLQVSWNSHTGTGNLLVKGLPYTSLDTTGLEYVFPVSTNGQLTYTNYDTLVSKLNKNSDIITLHTEDGASNTAQLTVQSSGKILITGHYFIS